MVLGVGKIVNIFSIRNSFLLFFPSQEWTKPIRQRIDHSLNDLLLGFWGRICINQYLNFVMIDDMEMFYSI